MTLTQSQGRDIFQHVVTTILGQPVDSNIDKAVTHDGTNHIHEFVTLNYPDVEAMTYDDGNGNQVHLSRYEKALIMMFIAFLVYRA